MPTIVIDQVSKSYAGRNAVDNMSFAVGRGELAVLLGPSGCGKSTTLRLIAGLDMPTSGRIEIDGQDVTRLPAAERHLSMVFQSYALFPHLSVAENIVFGLKVRRTQRNERQARLKRVAELVELGSLLNRKPAQLSGGQRQRVALARAIIAEKPVCLMDEPLSNLDAQLRHEMRVEIRALQQRLGMTMVYVTHDQTEAMTMADQVILMRDGRIEQAGPPQSLYDRPQTTFVARFIGTPPMNLVDELGERVLGIRPEHVRVQTDATVAAAPALACRHFPARVVASEYLGADTILTGRLEGGSLIAARIAGASSLKPDDRIFVQWERANEHYFDARSGCRRETTWPTGADHDD